MIQLIEAKRADLPVIIQALIKPISEPLFRGLSEKAQQEYLREQQLLPKEGSLSVGRGVFFTSDLHYALSFARERLLVSSKKLLDAQSRCIDTRISGYEQEIKSRLDQQKGAGNYSGFELWAEIQKQDTITFEGGPAEHFVYARRMPVNKEELIAEIVIIDELKKFA
ncbi:MAG: hypothetical protein AABW48_01525 [Nanoarchaeota archaeon]